MSIGIGSLLLRHAFFKLITDVLDSIICIVRFSWRFVRRHLCLCSSLVRLPFTSGIFFAALGRQKQQSNTSSAGSTRTFPAFLRSDRLLLPSITLILTEQFCHHFLARRRS
jgi:hypothetical protein